MQDSADNYKINDQTMYEDWVTDRFHAVFDTSCSQKIDLIQNKSSMYMGATMRISIFGLNAGDKIHIHFIMAPNNIWYAIIANEEATYEVTKIWVPNSFSERAEFCQDIAEATMYQTAEERYQRRLEKNRKSARAHRDRKRKLIEELTKRVKELEAENANLTMKLTACST